MQDAGRSPDKNHCEEFRCLAASVQTLGRSQMISSKEAELAYDGLGALVWALVAHKIGMTPDQQAKLFEEFSQADATSSRRFGDTTPDRALRLSAARIRATEEHFGQR